MLKIYVQHKKPPKKQKIKLFYLFIGPESDHWLCLSLTDCRLVNLIDVTLACEDGNSKLVEVLTVVYVDDEKQLISDLVPLLRFRS